MTGLKNHYSIATTTSDLYAMMHQDLLVASCLLNASEDSLTNIMEAANEVALEKGWERVVPDV